MPETIRGVNNHLYVEKSVQRLPIAEIRTRMENESFIKMAHTLAECADEVDRGRMSTAKYRRVLAIFNELTNELLDFEG